MGAARFFVIICYYVDYQLMIKDNKSIECETSVHIFHNLVNEVIHQRIYIVKEVHYLKNIYRQVSTSKHKFLSDINSIHPSIKFTLFHVTGW